MNAIDTNVLVYAVDASEPHKSQLARALLLNLENSPTPFVLLWQVAGEFIACLTRWEQSGRIHTDDTLRYLNHFVLHLGVAMPTVSVLREAVIIRQQYSVSHWDSMLLAACAEAGVTTLYSEDLGDGQIYGPVTVANPFRDS